MELILVDQEPELIKYWKREFNEFPEVKIECADILLVAENSIVSPGNSYGYMDGGIDRLYLEYFGLQLQTKVIDLIKMCPENYLPVGESIIVNTGNKHIPYLIVSPTMIIPGPVNRVNSYQAMSATLNIARKYPKVLQKIYCPGLGTGIGQIPFEEAAEEMALAYRNWQKQYSV